MSINSSSLQKWISASDAQALSAKIAVLEQQFPVEVVIALTEAPTRSAVGGARLLAALLLGVELTADYYVWPIPSWILLATLVVVLFLPASWLAKVWGNWLAIGPREREALMGDQVQACVQEMDLEQTSQRNAVLLFINIREQRFFLWTDKTIKAVWPEFQPPEIAKSFGKSLQQSTSPATALQGVLDMFAEACRAKWPLRAVSGPKANELSDSIIVWQP